MTFASKYLAYGLFTSKIRNVNIRLPNLFDWFMQMDFDLRLLCHLLAILFDNSSQAISIDGLSASNDGRAYL